MTSSKNDFACPGLVFWPWYLPYKHWVAKGGREILTRRTEVPQRMPDAQRTPKYSINPEGEQPVVRRGPKNGDAQLVRVRGADPVGTRRHYQETQENQVLN